MYVYFHQAKSLIRMYQAYLTKMCQRNPFNTIRMVGFLSVRFIKGPYEQQNLVLFAIVSIVDHLPGSLLVESVNSIDG